MIIKNAVIGYKAALNLDKNHIVKLYAKFSSSCYFQCENGEFIMLAAKEYDYVSFAISVDDPKAILNSIGEIGSELTLDVDGDVWIPNNIIQRVESNKSSLNIIQNKLTSFDDIFHEKINALKENIIIAAKEENVEETLNLLSSFLGLGQGLTPSADDWTFAFLYTLKKTKRSEYAAKVCQKVSDIAKPLTSFASYAYLSSLKEDDGISVINNILYTYESKAIDLALYCDILIKVGSSSGQDMLCGIYDALLLD